MQELKANTQVDVRIGPFVDVSDGYTPETGITLGSADEAELLKHNGAATVDISSNTWAAVTSCDGWYDLTLTTSDTNTEGQLTVVVQDDSECLPVFVHFMVLSQAAWDSKYAAKDSGYMDVNIKTIGRSDTQETEANNLESACSNYSATRGLTGTALPAAAADAAGGLPISDAGGLDLDTYLGRITGNVALASACTETRLAELDAGNLPSDVDDVLEDTGTTIPALIGAISSAGAFSNFTADSYTLTTGTESANSYTDTIPLDGIKHTHTDDAGEMDLYYEFLVGSANPSSVKFTGALTGLNDNLKVYGYNWITTSWVQIGTLNGKATSDNEVNTYDLFPAMLGTGANLGKVRIRFYDDTYTLSSATLYIDQLLVSGTITGGDYALGAIWVNTNASNENTIPGVDGVSTNPVSTWAAAKTLSSLTNIDRFYILSGSTITLDASFANKTMIGEHYTLNLGGQNVDGAHIQEAFISGIGTESGDEAHFINSHIVDDMTIGKSHFTECGIEEGKTLTLSGADLIILDRCFASGGDTPPIIDFNDQGGTIGLRGWHGGIEIKNMSSSDKFTVQGFGKVTIDSTCDDGGTIGISGMITIDDQVDGGFAGTLNDDARVDQEQILGAITDDDTQIDGSALNTLSGHDPGSTIASSSEISALNNLSAAQVNAEVDTALADYDGPTKAEMDTAHALLATVAKQDIIDTNIDAIKAQTDDQPAGFQKNVALSNFSFLLVDSDDHVTPKTGETVTAQISKDGGAFANCTNSVSEISGGLYKINLTQTEMNASIIVLKFTSNNSDQRTIILKTST